MALYMAKFNGRNRAYGIHRLARSDAETLAAAERDLEHAWKSGLVEMHVMYGPSPDERCDGRGAHRAVRLRPRVDAGHRVDHVVASVATTVRRRHRRAFPRPR